MAKWKDRDIMLIGLKGDKGEKGDTTKWYTGVSYNQAKDPTEGDLFLATRGSQFEAGDMYVYKNGAWSFVGNIRGAQGERGVQGEKGETGGFEVVRCI